jgi:ABC-type polysaccharide/polyol phosphate export permease
MLVVYTYVFSVVYRNDIPRFPLFLLTGIILWSFFSNSVSQSAFSIVANGALIKKVYFPRQFAPLSVIGLGIIDLGLSHIALALGYIYFGLRPSWSMLLLPFLMLMLVLFCVGLSLLVSSITVYFRDTKYLLDVSLLLAFFLTPIFYSETAIPENVRGFVLLNPMAQFIQAYRSLLLDNVIPSLTSWLKLGLVDVVALAVGGWVFERSEKKFCDFV